MASPNPFLLAADNNPALLPLLRSNSTLASSQDAHGYSILHAAASYDYLDLMRTIVTEFHVDPNIKDEDGETPLFVVETVDAAQVLVEELGADPEMKNEEGMTAAEKIQGEGDYPVIAAFLRETRLQRRKSHDDEVLGTDGQPVRPEALFNEKAEFLLTDGSRAPSLPQNVTMKLGTVDEAINAPADPEFQRRIEELAARGDFEGEEGQKQLRTLIADAVHDMDAEPEGNPTKRRLR